MSSLHVFYLLACVHVSAGRLGLHSSYASYFACNHDSDVRRHLIHIFAAEAAIGSLGSTTGTTQVRNTDIFTSGYYRLPTNMTLTLALSKNTKSELTDFHMTFGAPSLA